MAKIIAGQHLAENKHVWVALTYIYGIGRTTSYKLCKEANIKPDVKLGTLTESEIDAIRTAITNIKVEGDLRREVSMTIKRMMDMGTYAGQRHRKGLPVRGQRTKTNAKTVKKRRGKKKVKV